MLPFELTKDTPYLALSGELWGVFYEYFTEIDRVIKGFYCIHIYIHFPYISQTQPYNDDHQCIYTYRWTERLIAFALWVADNIICMFYPIDEFDIQEVQQYTISIKQIFPNRSPGVIYTTHDGASVWRD